MPRRPRVVFPGIPHHVTQRGARRQRTFFQNSDYERYLLLCQKEKQRCGVSILAYCLMPNHVHLVVVPKEQTSLNKFFKVVHSRFAAEINSTHGWSGHLWQSRFFSSALDRDYLLAAVRYVELNPVRAGIVDKPEEYPWSSTRAQMRRQSHLELDLDDEWMKELPGPAQWLSFLGTNRSEESVALSLNINQNLPCGSEQFIANLENTAGLNLRYRPPGRPSGHSAGRSAREKVTVPF